MAIRATRRAVLGASLAASVALVPSASANVFEVTTRPDHRPGKCSGADCTLREAVIEANERDGSDRIVVPGSDHPYKLTRDGEEDAARKGDLDLADDQLKIRGKSAKRSVIKQTAADRAFELVPTTGANSVTIERLTISGGHTGGFGGGVSSEGDIFLGRVSIRDNRALQGGGVAAFGAAARLQLSESTVSGNRGDSFAGGVMAAGTDGAANVISGTTIEGNRAPRGGGVLTRPGDANLHVIDSTITANLSPLPDPALSYSSGGGLYVESDLAGSGIVNIEQTTITANEAPIENAPGEHRAANIYSELTTRLENTIIGADLGGAPSCDAPLDSVGHNLDQGTTCGLDQVTDLEDADSGLKPLANNGGATQTMALRASSEAIDEGACPGTILQRGVDQRGLGRPSICDIGAFERDPLP